MNTFQKMFPKPCWNVFKAPDKDHYDQLVIYEDKYELYINFELVKHTQYQDKYRKWGT